jgi:hypothetical protein
VREREIERERERERERARESYIRNNLHNGVVSGAAQRTSFFVIDLCSCVESCVGV